MQKGIYYSILPGDTPEEKFAAASEIGFDCVEIPTLRTPEERKRFKDAADKAKIRIPSVMNSDHWSFPSSSPDPEVREKGLACIRQSLETALAVNADTVLLVPAVVNPEVRYEDAWPRSQAEIRKILPEFEAAKIYLAVENVGNKFLLSPPEMVKYIDEFKSPWLVAYFDVGNIVPYGFPQHWILSLGKRIKKIHVKGYATKPVGATPDLLSGNIDWKAVIDAIREVGYDDVLTAELQGVGETKFDKCRNICEDIDKILAM
ncbi:MAG: sugar phosphate isomerase/epimerase [Lentisphaerae bacterium]|jgi:L-ribulose-5-phosphate 3-epimerase|nr:sugar phosphate isomerase/epimerase [Lentisphaerota bacterium]